MEKRWAYLSNHTLWAPVPVLSHETPDSLEYLHAWRMLLGGLTTTSDKGHLQFPRV